VVFVSHDERLIELVADELWVVNRGEGGKPGTVTVFNGSFEEYKEMLEKEFDERAAGGKSKKAAR
jgi:ATPase subunit of ABC transporter with duplicated ATPase domains